MGRLAVPPVVLLVAAGVLAVDQLTKTLALEALSGRGPIDLFWTLRLRLSFNSGAAFGLGRGITPFLTVAAVVLLVVLLGVSRTAPSRVARLALGLVVGGAMGNVADRLFRDHGGAVVDFIDFQWWPVFNVADIGITVGAVLLVFASRK
jgi:signal peptidase II